MSRTTPRSFRLPPEASDRPDPEVSAADVTTPLDLARLFGQDGPVEVEIGFGKGRFLLGQAAARPGTLFLGIENAAPYVRLVRFRTLRLGLANVRILRSNAGDVFRRLLPADSLQAIYVFFPDPWPKRRHHRRRLVSPELAAACARALAAGGTLDVVTDHAEYSAWIDAAVAAVPALERQPDFRLEADIPGLTNFSYKLSALGRPIRGRTWRRRP